MKQNDDIRLIPSWFLSLGDNDLYFPRCFLILWTQVTVNLARWRDSSLHFSNMINIKLPITANHSMIEDVEHRLKTTGQIQFDLNLWEFCCSVHQAICRYIKITFQEWKRWKESSTTCMQPNIKHQTQTKQFITIHSHYHSFILSLSMCFVWCLQFTLLSMYICHFKITITS